MNITHVKKISEQIEKSLDYKFKNKSLIQHAMTHRSFCIGEFKSHIHNERLEFLGDAVLGLVIAENLMAQSPNDNEGALSKKRASLVNQDIFSEKAKKLNLQNYLILGPGEKEQQSHLKPRLLASAYEAIIGALYLDADFSFVKKYLLAEFNLDIEKIKPDLEFEKDYKTRLQELSQKMKLGMPIYELIETSGPSHKPEFKVSVQILGLPIQTASGLSKKIAEQAAAQLAITILEKQTKVNVKTNLQVNVKTKGKKNDSSKKRS